MFSQMLPRNDWLSRRHKPLAGDLMQDAASQMEKSQAFMCSISSIGSQNGS